MKKIICLALSVLLLIGAPAFAADQNAGGRSMERIKAFGIMTGTPDGEMNPDEAVTRGEFAAILVRAANLGAVAEASGAASAFSDVPAGHWAYSYVSLASSLGIMQGRGGGIFDPEGAVQYEEAVKSLVIILGYAQTVPQAQEGAWYQGYLAAGSRIGLLKNLPEGVAAGKALTRAQTAALVDNALSVEVRKEDGTGTLSTTGETLLDGLYDGGKQTGIVEANYDTGLFSDEKLAEDEVVIGGYRYRVGGTDAANLLGMTVEFYGEVADGEAYLRTVLPMANKNRELLLDGRDLVSQEGRELCYENGEGEQERVSVSETASLIYNERRYDGYPESILSSPDAQLRLIDNNNDGDYDVVFMTRGEVAKTMRASVYDDMLFLKSSLVTGESSVDMAKHDADLSMEDSDGNTLSLTDFAEEDTVCQVFTSVDGDYVRLVKLTGVVSGTVTAMVLDDAIVEIDGQPYEILKTASGPVFQPKELSPGSSYSFTLDKSGRLASYDEDRELSAMQYAYIYDIGHEQSGVGEAVQLKLLNGTTTERTKERDKYYLVGRDVQSVSVYPLAENVRIDGAVKKNTREQLALLEIGDVIQYTLNQKKEISKILTGRQMGDYGKRNYDAEVQVFGGISRGAFGINDKTVVFFLPEGSVEEDVASEMKYASGAYECQGFDETEEGYVAAAAVFRTDLDSDKEVYFNADVPFRVIQAVSECVDEDGDSYLLISGYENAEQFTYRTSSASGNATEVLRDAKCGDIVRFARNFRGEIATAQIIVTGYDEKNPEHLSPDSVYYERSGTGNSQVFGVVTEASYKALGDYSTEYENILHISTSRDGSYANAYSLIYKESEAPYYYIYDYDRAKIYPATFKDLVASGDASLDVASKVFLYSISDVVKIALIVR